jgi:plastocyanin
LKDTHAKDMRATKEFLKAARQRPKFEGACKIESPISNSPTCAGDRSKGGLLTARRVIHHVVFSVAVIMALVALSGIAASVPSGPTIVIKMLDMPPTFQPDRVTIPVGGMIKWENVGASVHHATSDPAAAIYPADVANPAGAKPFDSNFIQPNQSFSHTFTIPGTYKYMCAAHETFGMIGQVVVK